MAGVLNVSNIILVVGSRLISPCDYLKLLLVAQDDLHYRHGVRYRMYDAKSTINIAAIRVYDYTMS